MTLPAANYIRVFSDIHLDFYVTKKFKFEDLWMPEPMETDADTILVLAGDLWHAKKPLSYFGKSWLKEVSKNFKYVLCTLGNHDLWGGNFPNTYTDFKKKIKEQGLDNVFLLQNDTVIIGDIKFVGGTLWTDFMGGDSRCLHDAFGLMNDYKYIKYGPSFSKLKPVQLLGSFIETKKYIFEHAVKDYPEQQVWVLTHHSPSYQSLDDTQKMDHLKYENALYHSNLDKEIENSEISVWVHGHSHHAKSYKIGNTEVLANPKGYPSEQTEYNPWLLRDVSNIANITLVNTNDSVNARKFKI
jgi:UDP-2,3-diacylglucosamine pyrophosphatase LpxH